LTTTTKQEEAAFAPSFAQPKTKHKGTKSKAKKGDAKGVADLSQENGAGGSLSPEDQKKVDEHKAAIKEAREELLELMRSLPVDTDPDVLSLGPECYCSRCACKKETPEVVIVRLPVVAVASDDSISYKRELEPVCVECWAKMDKAAERNAPGDFADLNGEWDIF